jgi:hypothetical protein
MSIFLTNYKQLTECSEDVEQIEVKVNSKKRRRGLTKSEEDSPLLQPLAPAIQLRLSEF